MLLSVQAMGLTFLREVLNKHAQGKYCDSVKRQGKGQICGVDFSQQMHALMNVHALKLSHPNEDIRQRGIQGIMKDLTSWTHEVRYYDIFAPFLLFDDYMV